MTRPLLLPPASASASASASAPASLTKWSEAATTRKAPPLDYSRPPPTMACSVLLQIPFFPTTQNTRHLFSTSGPRIRRVKPLLSASAAASTSARPSSSSPASAQERVFFDGGAHYGDLVSNLLLGFTLLWLPLTLAAISRAFFLRYRFTNLRVTVVSGFSGQDRSDFPYSAVKDVQVVPRFIGEWGDLVITLKDGTVVDLRSVPKFREVADYCLYMANQASGEGKAASTAASGPKGF